MLSTPSERKSPASSSAAAARQADRQDPGSRGPAETAKRGVDIRHDCRIDIRNRRLIEFSIPTHTAMHILHLVLYKWLPGPHAWVRDSVSQHAPANASPGLEPSSRFPASSRSFHGWGGTTEVVGDQGCRAAQDL